MDDNGCLKVVGKERGRKKSLNKIVDMAAKQAEGYENEIIMITHGDCPEDAEYVAKRVQEKMGIQNIYINNIGTVIGGHTGPGVVAVFCMGDKREVKLLGQHRKVLKSQKVKNISGKVKKVVDTTGLMC